MDAPDLETAKTKRDQLIKEQKTLPEPIFKILWKFIVPYFKNLTHYIKNTNISRTSNKIENIFQKVFPKHIKRLMKTKTGLINRFKLKLEFWNIKNKNQNHQLNF